MTHPIREAVARLNVVNWTVAKSMGLKRYYTGEPCKNGHLAERFVSGRGCVTCAAIRCANDPKKAERTRKSQIKNRARRAEKAKEYRKNNPEKDKEYRHLWRLKHLDKLRKKEAEDRRLHRDERAQRERERYKNDRDAVICARKKWERKNPHKVRARRARYRLAKELAEPKWVDKNKIWEIYDLAVRKTKETGIPYEVDHIIPLQNKCVCGLHVPWNLQVITRPENLRKKNTFHPTSYAASIIAELTGNSPKTP